ncbi:hypothetical protein TNCV_757201 [Trichonephila clavipes]|nr:hypothetical protein TNCV_757201 [Trichonephila clavipes]
MLVSYLIVPGALPETKYEFRLKSFTNDNNFINPNQYGFARNLSTYHPLLGLTEKITAGFQRGRSTGAVFLDIQKAFDRVWCGRENSILKVEEKTAVVEEKTAVVEEKTAVVEKKTAVVEEKTAVVEKRLQ